MDIAQIIHEHHQAIGSLGGLRRKQVLSTAQLRKIARKGGLARQAKRKLSCQAGMEQANPNKHETIPSH